MGNSVSFRILYLLGVSSKDLKNDFSEDYKESDSLKKFEFYVDARLLRELVILRQYIFENYLRYKHLSIDQINEKKKNWSGIQKDISSTIEYIERENIPIQEMFLKSQSFLFFKTLNKMIDCIAYKVFLDLDVPFVDEMLSYIRFPILTERELIDYIEKYKKLTIPYKRIIYGVDKLKYTLKYVFLKDINCIQSGFSICGRAFDKSLLGKTFYFSYRNELGDDLDSGLKIDGSLFLDEIQNVYNETMLNKEKSNSFGGINKSEKSAKLKSFDKPEDENNSTFVMHQVVNEEKHGLTNIVPIEMKQKTTIDVLTVNSVSTYTAESEINRIRGFLRSSYLVMIFDLTTVSLFSVLNFLQYIQNTSIDLVFLYDDNQKFLFDVDKYNLNREKVHFIKKQNINIHSSAVLMSEICKYIYKNKMTKMILVSESWELIEQLQTEDDIEFGIVCSYINRPMDEELRMCNITYFNLNYLNWLSVSFIMAHILVEGMITLEVSKWKINDIYLNCKNIMLRNQFLFMSEHDLYQYVKENMGKVKLKLENNMVEVCFENARLQIFS